MGFDCTLHLVDERAVREEFVPRLLERSAGPTALDRVMTNADEVWQEVRTALRGGDPEEAASLVCQLAVTFSACSLPHQYERGFALSLWRDQETDVAVDYPDRFAFSPEPLFGDVVAKYPALRGRFPRWFAGNYSTGVFVPADRVPEVLAWAEQKVGGFAKGDRRQFKGLLGILRAAAGSGLAYWEATDLAVPMADQYPGDPALMLAGHLGNEPGTAGRAVEAAPLTAHAGILGRRLLDHWFVSADYQPFGTNVWDLSAWPPRLAHAMSEYAPYQARARDGRWLLFSETNAKASPRSFRPRVFSDLGRPPDLVAPVVIGGVEQSITDGGFVGDRPLVFVRPPHTTRRGDPVPPPRWLAGQDWQPVPGLPTATARPTALRTMVEDPVVGLVPLGNGGDVVVWDGDGYELRGERFEKTFATAAEPCHGDWSSVPAGADGFFYLSARRLFEVHRGGVPTAHAPKWTNLTHVGQGPGGGLVLKEGDNKDGDVGKLYFPADGTFIHIEPELFDDKDYSFIYWSPATDRLIVLSDRFLAIPTSAVLSLPRYRATTGRRVKP
jgi:hypothetical protein